MVKSNLKLSKSNSGLLSDKSKGRVVEIVKLSSPIFVYLPKKILEKLKFFEKGKKLMTITNNNPKKSYAQATSSNMSSILKLKENYPSLPLGKIKAIHKMITNMDKVKPCIRMTTKGLSRKQIIVPISKTNTDNIMVSSANHITNINRALKNVKSKVMVNYICPEIIGIIIVSNTVVFQSDLLVMKRYVKNINNIMSDKVQIPRLPQSKAYLKIIGILYYMDSTNLPTTLDDIEVIIKFNHIFSNLMLTFKPKVIKVSPKSDIAIIWIDIWNMQSGKNRKMLINRCFSIRKHISTIYSINMNLDVL